MGVPCVDVSDGFNLCEHLKYCVPFVDIIYFKWVDPVWMSQTGILFANISSTVSFLWLSLMGVHLSRCPLWCVFYVCLFREHFELVCHDHWHEKGNKSGVEDSGAGTEGW